ncbi:acyl-CoA dehydrogenase family protein [Actinomadura madurae]|uniref:acyl-CoA dehydrogenase family protein n=1 Tax=Actinomadura madurae TaxID=1993 RepID=UPI0020D25F34|nr:acyl-CoA dehydrogenase family protein [Actinomadura madurae]MCP9965059.1 acyl-CoA dehydrogenase family protein [Actinomadura madurae]
MSRVDTEALTRLRGEVRAFLAEQLAAGTFEPGVDSWLAGFSREFTRELGRRGWIGMVWPTEYGGHGRTARERFTVMEELLAVGAPVSAYWAGDRQVGPSLLRHGSEEQKRRFLPAMAAGRRCSAWGCPSRTAARTWPRCGRPRPSRRTEAGWSPVRSCGPAAPTTRTTC